MAPFVLTVIKADNVTTQVVHAVDEILQIVSRLPQATQSPAWASDLPR